MNDSISPTHRARVETSAQTMRDGLALPVAGTSAPMTDLLDGALTPDAPVAEARPFTSPAAPIEGRTTPNDGEDGRRGPMNRGGRRVVRPAPAGAPSARKPTDKPASTPAKTTSRPSSGMTGNSADQTTDARPAPVIFRGGGKLAGADLTRRTADLAAEYGVSTTYVKRVRTQCGVTKAQRKRPERVGPLTGADLSRPTRELVREYGVTSGAVNRARARNGVPILGVPASVLTQPGVDLTRPTKALAEEFCLSYSCIAKVRKRLGVTWWEGRKASPGEGARKRGGGHRARTAAEAAAHNAKVAASREVKRVADAQAWAPEPTTKTDAWILRELQADMTPIVILAKRWKEPIERLATLAARVGRNT